MFWVSKCLNHYLWFLYIEQNLYLFYFAKVKLKNRLCSFLLRFSHLFILILIFFNAYNCSFSDLRMLISFSSTYFLWMHLVPLPFVLYSFLHLFQFFLLFSLLEDDFHFYTFDQGEKEEFFSCLIQYYFLIKVKSFFTLYFTGDDSLSF